MITVLGSQGFIGRHVVHELQQLGLPYFAPPREEPLSGTPLGDVIYCIGLTADFRSRPFETVEAHVVKLRDVLEGSDLDSLLYLSSTRVYGVRDEKAHEDDAIFASPGQADDLYNISKVMGESLTLNCGRPARVARLSNVYGPDFDSDNLLPSLIREAVGNHTVMFQTSRDSCRDYVAVTDVARLLVEIALRGQQRIYNIACGTNVTNLQLGELLGRVTGCDVSFAADASRIAYPPIGVARIREEFGFHAPDSLDGIEQLVRLYVDNSTSHI
jgi:nucleoside-diphosphate-sugar epimerase